MKLRDAVYWARWHMRQHNIGDWNLVLYLPPSPSAFCCKGARAIGLSLPFALLNDMSALWQAIKHEIAHSKTREAADHGLEFRDVCYRELGVPTDECIPGETLNPAYMTLFKEHVADPVRCGAGERAIDGICRILAAEAGERRPGTTGTTDLRFIDRGTL